DCGLFNSASLDQVRAATLQAMLRDAREIPGVGRVIVLLSARLASKDLTEHAGLVYAGSIRHTTRLGRRRVWAELVAEIGNIPSQGDSQAVVEREMQFAARYAIPAEEAHLTNENAY